MDNNCKLLQASRKSDEKKKKRKKRKKVAACTTPAGNRVTPQVESLPPETLPVSPLALCQDRLHSNRTTGEKNGEQFISSVGTKENGLKVSPSLLAATPDTARSGDLVGGYVHNRESLRWEGILEDPQAEEKRLELYRANRRRRYISHREALLKVQNSLRATEIKAFTD